MAILIYHLHPVSLQIYIIFLFHIITFSQTFYIYFSLVDMPKWYICSAHFYISKGMVQLKYVTKQITPSNLIITCAIKVTKKK